MLRRFGVSIEENLMRRLDDFVEKNNFANRSQAIRHLVKEELVTLEWANNKEVAGALTLVYDHHKRDLVQQLLTIQHNFSKSIVSTQHIHLDHRNCLEIIVVKDNAQKAKALLDTLKTIKGVKRAALTTTALDI